MIHLGCTYHLNRRLCHSAAFCIFCFDAENAITVDGERDVDGSFATRTGLYSLQREQSKRLVIVEVPLLALANLDVNFGLVVT